MKIANLEQLLGTLKKVSDDITKTLPFKTIHSFLDDLKQIKPTWPSLRIGNLVAPTPIVQGGMGVGISLSGLASAVANAGGIGVIAANAIGLLEKDYYKDGREANLRAFRREIRKARELTDGIIGVNIMVAVSDFHELLDLAIEEKVDIVFMGAGLPIKGLPVEKIRKNGVKIAPIVSSARATEMIFKMWKKIYNDVPDAVVFEGPKAGGHLGFTEEQLDDPAFQVEAIVPEIAKVLTPYGEEFSRQIPLIAGGGVYSGEDIYQVLQAGAQGVQMATRFVATDECDADIRFKEAYINCTKEDIGIIKSPVGMPGRAIRNKFITDTEAGVRPAFTCAWKCLSSCKAEDAKYCISIALNNARRGVLQGGFVFAGTNAYRIKEIVPVRALISELATGYWIAERQKVSSKLENLVTSLQKLADRYKDLQTQVIELGKAYEQAITTPSALMEKVSLSELREKYVSTQAKARKLQLKMVEKLMASWFLLEPQAV
ncbi:MAG TPA: nitronate monooxygenase [Spirochaetales bacterium]|nr:nitronate monooxygenase [Spirochaetales bacterium]